MEYCTEHLYPTRDRLVFDVLISALAVGCVDTLNMMDRLSDLRCFTACLPTPSSLEKLSVKFLQLYNATSKRVFFNDYSTYIAAGVT